MSIALGKEKYMKHCAQVSSSHAKDFPIYLFFKPEIHVHVAVACINLLYSGVEFKCNHKTLKHHLYKVSAFTLFNTDKTL